MEQSQNKRKVRRFDDYNVSLGDRMRGLRASKGKCLTDVEKEILIKREHIVAIEQANLDGFKTKWVIPGYVRTYSKYLGMDPDDGYAWFCRESGYEPQIGILLKPCGDSENPRLSQKTNYRERWKLGSKNKKKLFYANQSLNRSIFDNKLLQKIWSSVLVCCVAIGIGYIGLVSYDAINSSRQDSTISIISIDTNPEEVNFSTNPNDTTNVGTIVNNQSNLISTSETTMGSIIRGEYGLYSAEIDSSQTADVSSMIVTAIEDDLQLFEEGDRMVLDETISPIAVNQEFIDPNQVFIVSSRAAWVNISKPDGTVIKEEILAAGVEYLVPQDIGQLELWAGNSGSIFFVVGDKVYGPAGKGTSVVKNVDLSAVEIRSQFGRVENDQIPETVTNIVLDLTNYNIKD